MKKRKHYETLRDRQAENKKPKYGADYLLMLDCNDEQNKQAIQEFIYTLKPAQKIVKNKENITIEELEKIEHIIFKKYSYRHQGINECYDVDKSTFFMFYVSIIHKTEENRRWLGDVNGSTLWETIAKIIIKVVDDIYKERDKRDAEETQNILY